MKLNIQFSTLNCQVIVFAVKKASATKKVGNHKVSNSGKENKT